MEQHQHNCQLPLGNNMIRRKIFGLGSDLHVWGAALCNGIEEGVRVRTYHNEDAWVWLDQERCDGTANHQSAMMCYFPHAELQCPPDKTVAGRPDSRQVLHNISFPIKKHCDGMLEKYNKTDWRAAGIEFLMTRLSPIVIAEAERQLNLVYSTNTPSQRQVPKNIITVHVRWGDKGAENKLYGIDSYIQAVHEIKRSRQDDPHDETNIFLSTEDPRAVQEFQQAAAAERPPWNIYLDQMYHDMLPSRPNKTEYNLVPHTSRKLGGKVGLWSLGSLLVAMEANAFVLTRTSNWSRLMDELRKNLLEMRGIQTYMVDISRVDPKFKEW